MTCRELSGFLADYVAGELPPDVHATFESHIINCGECDAFVAQYRATIRVSTTAYPDTTPDKMPEELVAAILASIHKEQT